MTLARPLGDLRQDTRGAVMLTGLFMACFLIGSLWFVIGIGDALVYRDRMQEAADHGAFAASAINAKGMNFISLCNLVLLATVTIHIILGIIHDIALALCIVSYGLTCGFWGSMRQLYTNYFDVLKPAAKAIHVATKVASYGYPVMGLAESIGIAKSYSGNKNAKTTVIPLSPALLSGASFSSITGAKNKEGLTLEAQPMKLVCRRIGGMAVDALFKTALGASGKGFGGTVLGFAKKIIGGIIELRYCNDTSGNSQQMSSKQAMNKLLDEGKNYAANKATSATNGLIKFDGGGGTGGGGAAGNNQSSGGGGGGGSVDPGFNDFWGEDGPMTVISPAKNGNEWFQSYAVNFTSMTDGSEGFVGMALGTKNAKKAKYDVKVTPKLGFYLAQSEFFFDCAQKWSSEGCNFEGNSTFALKWRARLRRFSMPKFTSFLGNVGGVFSKVVSGHQQFKKLQEQGVQLDDVVNVSGNLFGQSGVLTATNLKGFIGMASKNAENALLDSATNALRDKAKAGLNLGTDIDVPFH